MVGSSLRIFELVREFKNIFLFIVTNAQSIDLITQGALLDPLTKYLQKKLPKRKCKIPFPSIPQPLSINVLREFKNIKSINLLTH